MFPCAGTLDHSSVVPVMSVKGLKGQLMPYDNVVNQLTISALGSAVLCKKGSSCGEHAGPSEQNQTETHLPSALQPSRKTRHCERQE